MGRPSLFALLGWSDARPKQQPAAVLVSQTASGLVLDTISFWAKGWQAAHTALFPVPNETFLKCYYMLINIVSETHLKRMTCL